MSSEDENERDGLVQTSFTIHWRRIWKEEYVDREQFPIFEKYEETNEPAWMRKRGFEIARGATFTALKNALSVLFGELISEVKSYCLNKERTACHWYIPGSSTSSIYDTARRISSAAIIGPQFSSQFRTNLQESLKSDKDIYWIDIESRESLSLAATIQLLVARISLQASQNIERNAAGLSSLSLLPESSTVIIHFPSLAQHRYPLLNDLIKAIHASTQQRNFPRLILLFSVEGGSSILEEKLDCETIRLLDLQCFYTPQPTVAFEEFIKQFYMPSKHFESCRLWLGPSVLEFLQYQFFDRDFNLDKMVDTMELALHHHFTARPLSSATDLYEDMDPEDWKPFFYERLRAQYIQQDRDGAIRVPLKVKENGGDLNSDCNFMKQVLTTQELSCGIACYDYPERVEEARDEIRSAVCILHTLQKEYLLQQGGINLQRVVRGPRPYTLGGLIFDAVLGIDMSKLISRATGDIKKASLESIRKLLGTIDEKGWAKTKSFKETLASNIASIQEEIDKDISEGEWTNGAEERNEERGRRVQRKWIRMEELDAIKKKVSDWLNSALNQMIMTRPPLPQIYTYDFTTYITPFTDPTPRSNHLIALSKPLHAVNLTPDICRLYQMYQSAGKMINLADWYEAFSQSIQSEQKLVNSKRRHLDVNNEEAVQARFAQSVNELGKMGFLRKTRRLVDHVLKMVHDLPPSEELPW